MPADTSAFPAQLGALKRDHERLMKASGLLRRARGYDQTLVAMRGILLEVRRSGRTLEAFAAYHNLPLAELVASGIDPSSASLEDMERFIHPIIEGEALE